MSESRALVSVVIVAYRHRDYVAQAIASAQSQDYPNLEIVVVDDGSPDDTAEAIRAHLAKPSPVPASFHPKANGGVSSAFNHGIARARGRYIAILAADDYYLPGAITRWVDALEAAGKPALAVVHSPTWALYEDGRVGSMHGHFTPAEGACLLPLLTREAGCCGSAILFTRESFDAVGGLDEDVNCEDFDFYARLAAKGYEFLYVPGHSTCKRVLATGLGSDILRWKDSPFVTLEKLRASVTEEQRAHIRKRLWLYLMRLATQNGKYAIARDFTRELQRETGSAAAWWSYAGLVMRHKAVSALPAGLRDRLRGLRARAHLRAMHP